MATEANRVRQILHFLNSLDNCKAIKLHGNRFVESGTPDILCCYDGACWLFEVKLEGKEPSSIQRLRIAEWRVAGAQVRLVHNLHEVKKALGLVRPDPYLKTSPPYGG
jgi:hypothetical protein